MLKTHIRKIGAIVLLSVMSVLAHAADESLEKAAGLMKDRKYSAAYDLLEPMEADNAGDPNFDYLFGVAALQNGKATRAVFALERVLAVQPNNMDARAFIARAYFQLGEKETAKAEFKITLDQKPSPATSKVINDYMTAIDKSLGLLTTYNAYIEGTYGHDSNINSATSTGSFAVPALGGTIVTLNKAGQETSDNFMSANVGGSVRTPVAKNIDFFASANLMRRVNLHNELFDTGSNDISAGLQFKQAIDTYSVAVQDNDYYVDDVKFRHAYGLTGQWQRDLNATNQVNAFGQFTKIKYPDNDIRDAKRYVAGGGWAHVFSGDKTPVVFFSGYLGKEKPEDSSFDQFENNIYGMRAGGQLALTPKWIGFAATSYEYRDYKGDEPAFLKARKDDQFDLAVGLRYLGKVWTIKPQISYLNNNSNIAINDFDRTVASISFRHDFNW